MKLAIVFVLAVWLTEAVITLVVWVGYRLFLHALGIKKLPGWL